MRASSAVCMVLGTLSLAAAAQAPEDLRRLLDEGRADEAYRLGRRTPERLGDPAFDFVFGVAAINAGRAAEGVLALERFVLAFPDNDSARVELARGYYLLGDDARAKEEFEAALARKPSPEVARVIVEYLDAIRARATKYGPTATVWIELGGGYDSNPRAGVDNPLITLPVLGEVTVGDSGVRASDSSLQYGGGFRVTSPLAARAQVFAAGEAYVVRYPDLVEFDQNVYAGSVGAQGQMDRVSWRSGGSTSYQTLDRKPYRRTHAFFADGTFVLDERNALSLGMQVGRFGYEGSNAVRNAQFRTVAAGWKHLFEAKWRPEVEVSANFGREANVFADRQDLSRDLYGARLGVSLSPWRGWTLAAAILHQRSNYHEADPILQTTREDRYNAADVSLACFALAALQVRLELAAAKNDSNLALYEYRRRTAFLRARYEFR